MSFNINTATKQQLMTIKGVGETIADRILLFQEKVGFTKLTDLMEVTGVKGHIFGEVKTMGIYCKDPKEEGEEKMKEDIRTLLDKIVKIFKAGYLVHGQQWAKEQMNEVKELWDTYLENKDFENKESFWGLAVEAARQEFTNWKEEQMVRVYNVHEHYGSWEEVSDHALLDTATKEAWRWYGTVSGKYMPPSYTSMAEINLYWEMVQALTEQTAEEMDDSEIEEFMDKAFKIYFTPEMRLVAWLYQTCGYNTPAIKKEIKRAQIKARNMWGKAIMMANELILEDAAEEPSEANGTIDNLEFLADGLELDTVDPVTLEEKHGQTEGFIHGPNWLQIYHNQDRGYNAVFKTELTMRKLLRQGMKVTDYNKRKEYAEVFKAFNDFLWKLHLSKDEMKDGRHVLGLRTKLMMSGDDMGCIKKEDLQKLSSHCYLAVKLLMPKWTFLPNRILSYEEHMKTQGKAREAKIRMRERAENDTTERAAHERTKEMNFVDTGHVTDSGDWHSTDVMDEDSDNQEQVLMEKEIWF